jgi:hypothetical protein
MTSFKAVSTVFCVTLLGAAFSPSAKADEYNHKTIVTFSAPVEIPPVYITGMRILPAGTYVFKLTSSQSNRHIVQIYNKAETKLYATVLAIPNYRMVRTSKTVITFNEGIKGAPQPIRAWFYPGDHWGEEFVYPKARAVELAKVTKTPVPALQTEVAVEVEKPEEPAVAAVLQQAPIIAVKPTGEEVEVAQVIQTEPPPAATETAAAAPNQPAELPATSSSLPLIALCGLLALGGALSVRSIRNRSL